MRPIIELLCWLATFGFSFATCAAYHSWLMGATAILALLNLVLRLYRLWKEKRGRGDTASRPQKVFLFALAAAGCALVVFALLTQAVPRLRGDAPSERFESSEQVQAILCQTLGRDQVEVLAQAQSQDDLRCYLVWDGKEYWYVSYVKTPFAPLFHQDKVVKVSKFPFRLAQELGWGESCAVELTADCIRLYNRNRTTIF